ncbi:cysteine-rich CWC family protein [Bacillus sp. FJAT-26390]|uniref:cysteine-rich CWC family protein n=2 Tax=Bacillales TaxID=1385 RepID=UPI0006A77CBB|nr:MULTISPECIES: cysteine-rich CWC family protein [Bacillales]OBZ15959.1 hypothetical protein A7975_29410 [Bacillus sp. FJAT-26390]
MNCPICGKPNECGIKAVQEEAADCWCFRENFPKSLLQQVPEADRNKACICKSCAMAHQNQTKT